MYLRHAEISICIGTEINKTSDIHDWIFCKLNQEYKKLISGIKYGTKINI